MDEIKLEYVRVSGVKADLAANTCRISLDISLKTALPIREQLAMLTVTDASVDVVIRKHQSALPGIFDFPGGKEFVEDIQSGKVEISGTVNGKQFSTKPTAKKKGARR